MISEADILNARILIVDDQAANVAVLEQMLAEAGYVAVTSTQDPLQVGPLHHAHHYDLILLDLQMPVRDGFGVMADLKEIETGSYLPVLVITAQPDHKLRALKAGARDFISKPFDFAEVRLRVRNLLEVGLLHQQLTLHNYTRLENSQRIAGLGDWERDLTTGHVIWSEEIYRILGVSRQDHPPGVETFERCVHPDDLAQVRQWRVGTERLSRVDLEHRIIRPDGEVRHVHHIIEQVWDATGRPTRASGTIQDITGRMLADTALRASEERFKFVARAVSDAVWDWDLPANRLWWNEGFLTTFGFAAGEIEPSIETRNSRIHPEDRPRVIESLQQAVRNGADAWSAEYRFQRKDGSHAHVLDRGYILHDDAGQAIRMVGGLRDLTEQKKMEEQYLRAQRMESIGTLAGGIAHDLNNVLAPIMLSIDLLKQDLTADPRRTKILDVISTSSRRGADLVRQVLSFARGMDGERVAIRLKDLINELDGIINSTFPRNIRIEILVAADLLPISGDPTQLHQVLLNLAVNARDAMPDGGTLTVSADNITVDAQFVGTSTASGATKGPVIKPGRHVLLQVTDTGIGIPAALRTRIFEPFFTTKEVGKGTGIGLATVHTVVSDHGGFLTVESEVGQGTTFKLYLPTDPTLVSAESTSASPSVLPRGQGECVLVIDDDLAIQEITAQSLKAFGYHPITAGNGADAVALFVKQIPPVDLVITDMMMPIMDGTATIHALTRINPQVRIIAASGIDSGDNITKATRAGAMRFLPKPYTTEMLLTLVREALDQAPPEG